MNRDPIQEQVHSRDETRNELKQELFDFVKMLIVFLAVFVAFRTYVLEAYRVKGESMEPVLHNNDRILVFKLGHILGQYPGLEMLDDIGPGDIVVLQGPDDPGKKYVKRVIAMGPRRTRRDVVAAGNGDTEETVPVEIQDGQVFVNNHRIQEPYLPPGAMRKDESDPKVSLKPGQYYVMGDNRKVSKDSRSFKAVDTEKIVGKAILRFWPLNKIGLLE